MTASPPGSSRQTFIPPAPMPMPDADAMDANADPDCADVISAYMLVPVMFSMTVLGFTCVTPLTPSMLYRFSVTP